MRLHDEPLDEFEDGFLMDPPDYSDLRDEFFDMRRALGAICGSRDHAEAVKIATDMLAWIHRSTY